MYSLSLNPQSSCICVNQHGCIFVRHIFLFTFLSLTLLQQIVCLCKWVCCLFEIDKQIKTKEVHFVYLGVLYLFGSICRTQTHVLFLDVWFNFSLLGNFRPIETLLTGQTQSNNLSDLSHVFPKAQNVFLSPLLKAPTVPDHFVLMYSNRYTSNSSFSVYFFPLHFASSVIPRYAE